MPRSVSLSQFMPYGAPDLLAAAPSDLSRATLVSCGFALLMFAVAALLPSARPAPPSVSLPPPIIDVTSVRVWRPVSPVGPIAAPRPTAASSGAVLPVPDTDAPEAFPGTPPADPGSATPDRGAPPTPVGLAVAPPAAPPDWEHWVYVEELPVAITVVKASYPELAWQAGVEGTVLVHVLVGTDGRVLRAEPDQGMTVLMLQSAAVEAAMHWAFRPARANGRAVAVWVAIPFRFQLH